MNVVTMQYVRAMEFLRTLRDREEGQALVEYGLIIGLVSVVVIAALTVLGTTIHGYFNQILEHLGITPP